MPGAERGGDERGRDGDGGGGGRLYIEERGPHSPVAVERGKGGFVVLLGVGEGEHDRLAFRRGQRACVDSRIFSVSCRLGIPCAVSCNRGSYPAVRINP